MNRSDLTELHYITLISNVTSILQRGILSHTLADELDHDSVAMPEIQELRTNKRIPGARRLHEYANLYFDAHNPMLSKCRQRNNEICVLRVSPAVLDLAGVIIADRNAASDWVSFWPVTEGLARISRERVFAKYWTHSDLHEQWRHKSEKCAEVLVPDLVEPQFVIGAYVANQTALASLQTLITGLPAQIQGMFF